MGIGENIRRERERVGLTQDELAQRLGYKTRSSIAKIESGANDIPQSKIVSIANALGVTPAYLMGWEDISERYEESEENLNAPLDVIEHFNGDAKKIYEFQKIVGLDAQSEDIPETPKLRSIARLENSSFTPDEDDEILNFIKYIESKRNGGE